MQKTISKIDITSNEIETINCDSYEVKNGYAVIKNKNELLASTIEDFKFNKIMDLSNVSSFFDYYIHNVNDKPYLHGLHDALCFIMLKKINELI